MSRASYVEDITERLYEEQKYIRDEIASLRERMLKSDIQERESVGAEIAAFKTRFTNFLDELDQRSRKIFDEAISRLNGHEVRLVAFMNKRDGQAIAARDERKKAVSARDRTREVNAALIGERDKLAKGCGELRAENEKLKRELADLKDWRTTVGGIKKR
jgi:hypothetical protein